MVWMAATSLRTILPTGMPVQSATTAATVCGSTSTVTSGVSFCTDCSLLRACCSRSSTGASPVTPGVAVVRMAGWVCSAAGGWPRHSWLLGLLLTQRNHLLRRRALLLIARFENRSLGLGVCECRIELQQIRVCVDRSTGQAQILASGGSLSFDRFNSPDGHL